MGTFGSPDVLAMDETPAVNRDSIRASIAAAIACEELRVRGDGHHFEALIVCAAFEGKSRVAPHQLVYAALGDRMRNTAVLTYSTGSDTAIASTAVNCYAPVVTKTAAGAYDERHEWDVETTVSPVSQSAFAGDTVSYEWTVTVEEEVFEENFVASGTITIVNHNAEDAMTVALSDVLNGTTATITACTGDADLSDGLTIAAGGTSVCDYTAVLPYKALSVAPTNNTATAVLNGISYSASDGIEWTANVIRGSVSLDDDPNPGLPGTISNGGTWNYTEQYTCSTTKTEYNSETHQYTFGESNTATLTSGAFTDSSSASTAVNCYIPTISKTANGTYDEVHDWEVFKTDCNF